MALSATRLTDIVGGVAIPRKNQRPVRNGVTLYKGGMVAADSAGSYVPAGNANAVTQCQGVLMEVSATQETVTGNAAGTETARLTVGIFWFGNSAGASAVTAGDLGQICYAVDDETVSIDDANGTLLPAGVITDVDATLGVAVSIIPQIPLQTASAIKRVAGTIGANGSGEDYELTAAGLTQTFSFGDPLPPTAIVLCTRFKLPAVFANGAAASLNAELGHDGDSDAYDDPVPVLTGSTHAGGEWQHRRDYSDTGPAAITAAGTRQLQVKFTQNADQLVNTTGGPLHVEFLYLDIPSIL
jgi:hypothetical protein